MTTSVQSQEFASAAAAALNLADALRVGETAWTHQWQRSFGEPLAPAPTRAAAQRAFQELGDAALAGSVVRLPDQMVKILHSLTGTPLYVEMVFALGNIMMRRIWMKHRIAYGVDLDLWRELGTVADDQVVQAEVFQALPHPNPYIHFPEPVILDAGGESTMRVVGMLVTGHRPSGADLPPGARVEQNENGIQVTGGDGNTAGDYTVVYCSTDDPGSAGLTLTFLGVMCGRDGAPLEVNMPGLPTFDATLTRVGLEFPQSGTATFAELVAHIRNRFTKPYHDPEYRGDPYANMEVMVRHALAALVYVCAVNADQRREPTTSAKSAAHRHADRTQSAKPPKPPKEFTFGYRVGAALRAHRERTDRQEPTGADTGPPRAPHIRRAHFHTFLWGEGRKKRRVKWLPPIAVNVGDDDGATVTVIPVQKPDG